MEIDPRTTLPLRSFSSRKFWRALTTTTIIGGLPAGFSLLTMALGPLSGPFGVGAILMDIAGLSLLCGNLCALAVLPFLSVALIRAIEGDYHPAERTVLILAIIFFALFGLALLAISLFGGL
jgi:hypothetical protein